MSRAARTLPAFLALVVLVATARVAAAQQVFTGDPVDPGTSLAYPMMPGLPLMLPGDDGKFATHDDPPINTMLTGDVDLVVRAGNIAASAIPAPALASGGPAITTVIAGGGRSGQGGEATFTAMVSDGTGSPAYGNVVTNSDMDLRPVTVYAFADLDGDGVVGPTNADGSSDNALEKQEAAFYAGRQMGGLFAGRFTDSVGIEMGAPASIGGLRVALVGGAYTGVTANKLFTDGPLIMTRWPFFPPLDPKDLLGGGSAPAPDPNQPNQLEWNTEINYLPSPGHPVLGTPFALSVSGSEPTTDQVRVDSAPATSARVFAEPVAAKFLARARAVLRVGPPAAGSGRVLVMPVSRVVLAADGATSRTTLRVLPVDLFANVADPSAAMPVTLAVSGSASIVSPDTDGNPKTEALSLADAAGAAIVLDDDGTGNSSSASLRVSVAGRPVQTLAIAIGASADSDGDGVPDDGNASGLAGDKPCDAATASCDDNCPRVINPSQIDTDHDGIGDCCDGTCVLDPLAPSCGECALPVDPPPTTPTPLTSVKLAAKLGGGTTADKVTLKLAFALAPPAVIFPDAETVMFALTETGQGGWTSTLASVFVDLMKSAPSYRYLDPSGAQGGVTKAAIRCDAVGSCKLTLKASGIGIADLAAGSADLSMALGDDLFDDALTCTGTSTSVKCVLAP